MLKKKFEETINEFYLVTYEYCRLVENISSLSKRSFLSNVQKILNLVYLKACLIERPDLNVEEEPEKFVSESDWLFIKEQLSLKLSSSDKFIDLVLPENSDPENYEAISLSECFADIYQDLKDFSTAVEIGNEDAIQCSLYECIENFEKFWGIRALSALISIHNLIYGEDLSDDETSATAVDESDINPIDTSNWIINKRFNN